MKKTLYLFVQVYILNAFVYAEELCFKNFDFPEQTPLNYTLFLLNADRIFDNIVKGIDCPLKVGHSIMNQCSTNEGCKNETTNT